MLKIQFVDLNGFNSTLLQDKAAQWSQDQVKDKVQIIFCSDQHHWIVASTVGCKIGDVKIYDSVFRTADEETKKIVQSLFKVKENVTLKFVHCQKQKGSKDCGVFSIAFATAIAFKVNTHKLKLDQQSMRCHLVKCLHNKCMSPFPSQ